MVACAACDESLGQAHSRLLCACRYRQAITPSPTFLAYAIPLAEVTAAGIVASTPCGLEVAGDGDVNHPTLAGTVVGETTVRRSRCALFARESYAACMMGMHTCAVGRVQDTSFVFELQPFTECV